MKALLSLLFAFVATLSAFGQQAQEDLRTDRQLVFPTFRKAKVLQTFGRSITAEANVLYRDERCALSIRQTERCAKWPMPVCWAPFSMTRFATRKWTVP